MHGFVEKIADITVSMKALYGFTKELSGNQFGFCDDMFLYL